MSLSLCVFCGSSGGTDSAYEQAAAEVGEMIARRGWTLVYGAGSVGMMGTLGSAALAAGGNVVGIIPRFLTDWEPPLAGLSETIYVNSMAERKIAMAERADAFLSLPGGIGTMDEFFEMWTLEALDVQTAPSALLDVNGYFQPLLTLMDHMTKTGFLRKPWRDQILCGTNPKQLLDQLEAASKR